MGSESWPSPMTHLQIDLGRLFSASGGRADQPGGDFHDLGHLSTAIDGQEHTKSVPRKRGGIYIARQLSVIYRILLCG